MEAIRVGRLDKALDLPRRGDTDRVGEDDLLGFELPEVLHEARDDGRVDAALEGAAERNADRDRRLIRPCLDHGRGAELGLLQRRIRVPLVERLGGREGHVHPVERARLEALEALLVEDQPRVLDPVAAVDSSDDLLGAGHLRHRVVADEADRLDSTKPGRSQSVDQLGPGPGRHDVLLVLEPVARPDVADRDQCTRSGVTRTITRRSPGRWLWNFGLPVYFSESLSM